ncbi:MAG TPA: hypothetical protein VIN10_01110 [Bacteroidales bacterium]
MNKITILIVSLALFLSACKKEEIQVDPNNLLLGIWNVSEYVENTTVYNRSSAFVDEYGYEFKSDGTLTERQNAGWCGTPPITYADYDGTWNVVNDTLIQITVNYWGGTMSYYLDIESVDSQNLRAALVLLEE